MCLPVSESGDRIHYVPHYKIEKGRHHVPLHKRLQLKASCVLPGSGGTAGRGGPPSVVFEFRGTLGGGVIVAAVSRGFRLSSMSRLWWWPIASVLSVRTTDNIFEYICDFIS